MEKRLPGDLTHSAMIDRMLRVDHAGEYGAVRIYAGQLAVLRKRNVAPVICHMAEQEQRHLERFNHLIAERRARPSALLPLWHVGGFALGALTALMGEKAAMACTVAVEEVIEEHYARQEKLLGSDEVKLKETIIQFRQEELEHRDTGLERQAASAIGYPLLSKAIKTLSRASIWVAERV